MRAGRADIQYRPDALLQPILFCNPYQCLEVDVYVILILGTGIVDEDFNTLYIGKMGCVTHITYIMGICAAGY